MKTKIYKLCCAALLGLSLPSHAQMITTFAGDAINGAGYTGDGGSASLAQLNHPRSVALDDTGNVYIVDAYNNMIRKVEPSSIISTYSGIIFPGYSGDGFPAAMGQYDHPNYVVIDASHRMYICDPSNQAIRMIDNAGLVNTIVGDGTATAGYSGDGGPATAALINFPSAIAVDNSGNLFIADQGNNVIRKVDASGVITTIAGTGNTGYSGEGGPATAADIGFPYGLAVDNAGNIFVGLYFDGRVCKIDAAGTITTYAGIGGGTGGFGGDGGPATAATFEGLWGICLDAAGNLYIADNVNQRIRKVDKATGIINTVAGNGSSGFAGDFGPATAAKLRDPVGVTVGPDGSIYISEYNNHIVRKVAGTLTHGPTFSNGHHQSMTICMNDPATPVNTYLAVADADAGQNEVWSTALAPLHGTLVASYTTMSTGSLLTPTGLTYTPTAGYAGPDSFRVRIFDGTASDTTTVVVNVNACVSAAPTFAGGHTQSLNICKDATSRSIDTVLSVDYMSTGQTISWSAAAVPAHGSLVVTYSTTSTGSTLIPSGLTYTPTSGYVGTDMFKVRATDGTNSDTTTINVTITDCSVSVPEVNGQENGLRIFPNPNSGTFSLNLHAAANEQAQVTIRNVVGEIVKKITTTTNSNTEINMNVPAGIYILDATTTHGKWSGRITVKQ